MGVVGAEIARMNQGRKNWKPILLTARQRVMGGGVRRRPSKTPSARLGMAGMSKRRVLR